MPQRDRLADGDHRCQAARRHLPSIELRGGAVLGCGHTLGQDSDVRSIEHGPAVDEHVEVVRAAVEYAQQGSRHEEVLAENDDLVAIDGHGLGRARHAAPTRAPQGRPYLPINTDRKATEETPTDGQLVRGRVTRNEPAAIVQDRKAARRGLEQTQPNRDRSICRVAVSYTHLTLPTKRIV